MAGTWFTADLHFGHQKVSEIRGFKDPEWHDDSIMSRWERQVTPNDTVYVLGDISSGSADGELKALSLLAYLPGKKRLICGNHDSVSGIHRRVSKHTDRFRSVFESISDHGRVRIDGRDILLSHYPYATQGDGPGRGEARYAQFRLPDQGGRLIHGHTHHTSATGGSSTGRELCVSWDAWRRLVNMGDVVGWLEGRL